jgi:nicotinate-nucleotide adenylyltransferase
MKVPQRVGVMGGTFDPVHLGHLRVAEEAVEELQLDTLLFVPAAVPPHKSGKAILPFAHRWEMLRLATETHSRFMVSDIEQRLPGKSYTVLTLRKLSEAYGDAAQLFFIAGLDAFLEMDTWWHFHELFRLSHLVVLRRPGYHESEMLGFLRERVSSLYAYDGADACYRHPQLFPVHCLSNTWLDISSTRIRQLAKAGKSVRYLVPAKVMHYIEANRLYGGVEYFENRTAAPLEPYGQRAE